MIKKQKQKEGVQALELSNTKMLIKHQNTLEINHYITFCEEPDLPDSLKAQIFCVLPQEKCFSFFTSMSITAVTSSLC